MIVDQVLEAAEIDQTARNCLARIGVLPLEDFADIMQRLKDSALARTIGAEQQRDWAQLNDLPGANTLEIFDLDPAQSHDNLICYFTPLALPTAARIIGILEKQKDWKALSIADHSPVKNSPA